MNEPHQDLAQQALEHPVKYTFILTKEIIQLNTKLFTSLAAIIVVLGIASVFLPNINFLFTTLINVLLFCLFFFVGKTFDHAKQMHEFVTQIEAETLSDLWTKYAGPSIGAYLGWIVAIIPIGLLIAVIIFSGQNDEAIQGAFQQGNVEALLSFLPFLVLSFAIIGLVLYVTPLVFVNILRTDNFNDAFKSVFSLYQSSLWKRAFTSAYFKYMTVLGLSLTGIIIIFTLLMGLLESPATIQGLGIIFIVFTLLLQIVVNIIYAISAMIADRLSPDM